MLGYSLEKNKPCPQKDHFNSLLRALCTRCPSSWKPSAHPPAPSTSLQPRAAPGRPAHLSLPSTPGLWALPRQEQGGDITAFIFQDDRQPSTAVSRLSALTDPVRLLCVAAVPYVVSDTRRSRSKHSIQTTTCNNKTIIFLLESALLCWSQMTKTTELPWHYERSKWEVTQT